MVCLEWDGAERVGFHKGSMLQSMVYDKDYGFDYQASHAIEHGRTQVAARINARPDEIIFTSEATESDNLALFGIAERYAE